MARSISVDLRRRVCAAIEEGLSCREAAARFKVSASSAIRWQWQMRRTGCVTPQSQGGNRRSARIDAHADFLLATVEARSDIALAELREELPARGVPVGIGSLWRFFDRRRITLIQRRPMVARGAVGTESSRYDLVLIPRHYASEVVSEHIGKVLDEAEPMPILK